MTRFLGGIPAILLTVGITVLNFPFPPNTTAADGQAVAKVGRTDADGDALPHRAVARFGTARLRHGGNIYTLAFSQDGKSLASGDWYGAVSVWDAATGKELRRFKVEGWVYWVAFTPDGKGLLATTSAGPVQLWDLGDGKLLRQFGEHQDQASLAGAALSPDGKILALLWWGKTLSLWATATGQLVRTIKSEEAFWPSGVAFSPDGSTLAAVTGVPGNNAISLWEAATGKVVQRFAPTAAILCPTFAPQGNVLAAVEGDSVCVRALPSGRVLWRGRQDGSYHGGVIHRLAFSADGKQLACASWSGQGTLWEATSGRVLGLEGEELGADVVAFSPNGKWLALGSYLGIRLWDMPAGREHRAQARSPVRAKTVAFSSEGRSLHVSCDGATVWTWDVTSGREVGQLNGLSPPQAGRVARSSHMALSSDGQTLATAAIRPLSVRLWDLKNKKLLRELKGTESGTLAVAFTPDGKQLLSGGEGDFSLRNVAGGQELRRFPYAPKVPVVSLAFCPDGKRFVSGGRGHFEIPDEVKVWDIMSGQVLVTLKGDTRGVLKVAFSPDGRTVLSAHLGGEILLWEMATGEERCRFYKRELYSIALSPDGRTLATSGRFGDWAVCLWDVTTGELLERLVGHRGYAMSLAFAPDGRTLASVGGEGSVLLWDVANLTRRGPRAKAARLTPQELERLWDDLAGSPTTAYEAMGKLAVSPQALPFLGLRLRRFVLDEQRRQRIARLIADLDGDRFAVREKADRELRELGETAGPALRHALAAGPHALEMRRRLERLTAPLEGWTRSPEWFRLLRTVEALEQSGTAEARRLLEELAQGAPEAPLTREARATLARLAGRK